MIFIVVNWSHKIALIFLATNDIHLNGILVTFFIPKKELKDIDRYSPLWNIFSSNIGKFFSSFFTINDYMERGI